MSDTSSPTIKFVPFMLVGLLGIWIWDKVEDMFTPTPPIHTVNEQGNANSQDSSPSTGGTTKNGFACSAEKKATAREVLDNLTTRHGDVAPFIETVRETPSGGVRYQFGTEAWEVVEQRLSQLVHAVADADACVNEKARRLDFFDPHGQRVGYADPQRGVKVFD